ncbi:HVA22-like protein j isoform X2 [Phragmites australis]|uniref:HVA22-like protein j isoform X2 n=1 Tax=Phragmites australis TaxID=29695 RepID=UPI002D77E90D|nr:HVA22-like protein j isoform X2 [Phragmites australis]
MSSGFGASTGNDSEDFIPGIILVILVIFDEIAGALISKIPMYYELKLAFLVYLWYPKTRGTDIVYETFLRPLVMQYEPNIEARLQYLRANAGDILVFYLKNFTERGYDLFLRALDYVRSQASRGSRTRNFFSFRGDRAERPSFVDDYGVGGDRRDAARHRRPRGGY